MYQVRFKKSVVKQLEKMDKQTARLIKNWITKNLVDCIDPRQHGKSLNRNLKGFWRYRVGDYRLFADIQDDVLIIEIIKTGHQDIYK